MRRYIIYFIIGLVVVYGVWQTIQIIKSESGKPISGNENEVAQLEDVGSVAELTILPLYERNASSPDYQTGAGVSYLISAGETTLLMDTGDNLGKLNPSQLEQNMQTAGVTFDQIDAVVISHLHPDHIGGNENWLNKTIGIGPNTSLPNTLPIYLPEPTNLEGDRGLVVTKPTKLAQGVVSLGAINFNNPLPISFIRPTNGEQALAIKVDGLGVILITGCGHPGLQVLITRAEAVMGEPVVGVFGGLHYKDGKNVDLANDAEILEERKVQQLAISPHDSDVQVIETFRTRFPDAYADILVGQPVVIKP